MSEEQKLTKRQALFCKEYAIDQNGRQAAIRAGYAKDSASKQAHRLLHEYPAVKAEVKRLISERNKKLDIDRDFIVQELIRNYQRVMADVKPKLNSKTGKPITDSEGNPVFTYNSAGAAKFLELLGKHVDIAAFKDRVVLEDERDKRAIELLNQGLNRISKEDQNTEETESDEIEFGKKLREYKAQKGIVNE